MPIYPWTDELTGYTVEIMRSFSEHQDPPKDDDLPEEEQGKERKWKKLIGSGIKTTYAQGSLKGKMGRGY